MVIVTPLGTISPYPTKKHNCPGFLIDLKEEHLLLDCGNGIVKELNIPRDLENLSIILTHFHRDHIGDIGAIQYASYVYHNLGLLKEKVILYLPKEDFQFVKKEILNNKESYMEYRDIELRNPIDIGSSKVYFHRNLSHPIETYSIRIEDKDASFVYTSDMGPISLESFCKFAENCDVLLSESSFLERHNASSKVHLTALEAAQIAKCVKAKKLVLTHFWPGETKEDYEREAKQIFRNTELAEENKKIYVRR